jgi:serine/threonine protein kinase/TPR repeat protein
VIGRDVGNYRITALLGEGGMGLVYLGEHTAIDRKVAIKVLRADLMTNADALGRFMNEARVASTIRHPNVIEVFDTGVLQPETVPFIVMELLEGEALDARIARLGRVEIPDALRWANETAAGLAAAHAKGIIHRDLKPANLYLVADDRGDGRDKIKVLDFGIAKLRGGMGVISHTQTGSLIGTPHYMSPEQCRGTKEIDTRSDIYSLGVILYEMLCGAPPFTSSGLGELISMQLMMPPEPPRARNPAISEALEAVVLRALAKDPDARYATVQELQVALGFEPSRVLPTPPVGVSSLGPASPATPTGSRPPGTGTPAAHTPSGIATPSAARVGFAGATQVAKVSIMRTPLPGSSSPTGSGGAKSPTRQRRGLAIAGGVAAGLAILLGVAHGQLGPRLTCLTGGGCTDIGDCYNAGKCGIAKDQKHACEIYDKDCTAGKMPSCVRLGHCYETHTGGVTTNWTRSCDLYDKACSADDMSGCAHLADCYSEGVGGKARDSTQGCSLAKRACDNGDQYGCVKLGGCFGMGYGGFAKDEKHGCDLDEHACEVGESSGCTMLSFCYVPGDEGAPQGYGGGQEKACQSAEKDCDAGAALSCWLLGDCYSDGKGGFPKNEKRACELWTMACDDGGFPGKRGICDDLANCYRDGKGGFPKDAARALSLQQRVCDDGDATECANVAGAFKEGTNGATKDPGRACQLYEKACAGGMSCLEAAHCHCNGLAGVRNPARAHELYRKACDGGDKAACDEDKSARCGDEVSGTIPAPTHAVPAGGPHTSPPSTASAGSSALPASGHPPPPSVHRMKSAQLQRPPGKAKAAKDDPYGDAE